MGIEPNEHRIPRFLGKYGYPLITQKTLQRPNSPMFSLCLSDVGVRDSSFE